MDSFQIKIFLSKLLTLGTKPTILALQSNNRESVKMLKFNNVARVKLVETKNLKDNKYRLVCAFHVTETFINSSGT